MKLVNIACPSCREQNVFLTMRMQVAQVGDFSLAGGQTKFSMSEVPVLVCSSMVNKPGTQNECDWELVGRIEGGEAVFERP